MDCSRDEERCKTGTPTKVSVTADVGRQEPRVDASLGRSLVRSMTETDVGRKGDVPGTAAAVDEQSTVESPVVAAEAIFSKYLNRGSRRSAEVSSLLAHGTVKCRDT